MKLANTPALKPPYTFNLFSFDIPLVYERARFRLGCPIGDQSTKERYLDTDTINYFANYVRGNFIFFEILRVGSKMPKKEEGQKSEISMFPK